MDRMNKQILKICIFALVFVTVVAGAFFGATTVRFYFFRPYFVGGDSMEPTLQQGSLQHVNTTATPRDGDVAVFLYTEDGAKADIKGYNDANAYLRSMPIWGAKIADTSDSATLIIKRVMAMGGETIELRAETVDGVNFVFVYRNGQRVQEDIVMLNRDALDETMDRLQRAAT